MPGTTCCVPLCNNKGGHYFKSDLESRKLWMAAIKRDKWTPNFANAVVCKKHFLPEDYITHGINGQPLKYQKLKPTAVPSVFQWTKKSESSVSRAKRYALRTPAVKTTEVNGSAIKSHVDTDLNLYEEEITISEIKKTSVPLPCQHCKKDSVTIGTQTPEWPEKKRPLMTAEDFREDDEGIHYFTGLESYEKFNFVLSSLGPNVNYMNYHYSKVEAKTISIIDQFFLVMLLLRRNTPHFELSRIFRISSKTVSNVFITWINFMKCQWEEIDIWASRDLVKFFTPSDFAQKFPTTRIIIDGTECPIKKPKAPAAQRATFSTYKNRNTVKTLIGGTPGGQYSYCSPAFGGSASDRQIIERSDLSCYDPGDSIMADKGFNVQDIFAPYDVKINIPEFFSKKNRMDGDTVLKDRKVASKRVHIERLIGLLKTYNILTEPMDSTDVNMATSIMFDIVMICNFRTCIMSPTM